LIDMTRRRYLMRGENHVVVGPLASHTPSKQSQNIFPKISAAGVPSNFGGFTSGSMTFPRTSVSARRFPLFPFILLTPSLPQKVPNWSFSRSPTGHSGRFSRNPLPRHNLRLGRHRRDRPLWSLLQHHPLLRNADRRRA